jgi:hypothetical protein
MNNKVTEFCTRILIIYSGLLIGQVLFFAVVFFALKPVETTDPSRDIYLYISIGLLLIAMTFGIQLSKNRLATIRGMEDVDQRILSYQSMLIIQFALLECANLFSIVAFLLTGHKMIAIVTGVGILVFLALIPLKNRVLNALDIRNTDL